MDTHDTLKLRPLVIACLAASLAALIVTIVGGVWLAQEWRSINFKGIADRVNEQQRKDAAKGEGHKVQAYLVVLRGDKPGMKYALYEGKNYIGRADVNPVDIDLEIQESPDQLWSSPQHAVITVTGDKMVIEDLKSSNGTFVNRKRVYPDDKADLKAKDIIQIGKVQLEVVK